MSLLAISGLSFAAVLFGFIAFLASRYRRCNPNQIMVISGKTSGSNASKCIHGGGAFIIPLIQEHAYLSLKPITIDVPLTNALTSQNIRVNVPATFTVAIGSTDEFMQNAANRLLGLSPQDINQQTAGIIFGQLRQTIAEMTIEEINADRDKFLKSIMQNVGGEINKIGLTLINVNIEDITDSSDYIESIGRKAASTAVNQAKIAVAEQEKKGAIGVAQNTKDQEINVADNQAQAAKGQKDADADQRIHIGNKEAEAVAGENTAQEDVARSESRLKIVQNETKRDAEVSEQNTNVDISNAEADAKRAELTATDIVPAEINKTKQIIDAQAIAEQVEIEAKGEAAGYLADAKARADGVKAMLTAMADGFKSIVESAGSPEAAIQMMLTDKMEVLTKIQVDAIKDLQIDKLIVWDGGSANGQGGLEGMMNGMVKSIPQLHDLAAAAGIQLPEFLGTIAEDAPKAIGSDEELLDEVEEEITSDAGADAVNTVSEDKKEAISQGQIEEFINNRDVPFESFNRLVGSGEIRRGGEIVAVRYIPLSETLFLCEDVMTGERFTQDVNE